MARLNLVQIMGEIQNTDMEIRTISAEKTDGKNSNLVLNFLVKCFDEKDNRSYTLPVAVWGKDEVIQCKQNLKEGSFVYVRGELRYKFVYNKEKRKMDKVYTTIKAETVEFISKKMKDEPMEQYLNEIKIIGNLVDDPVVGNVIKEYPEDLSVILANKKRLQSVELDIKGLLNKEIQTVNDKQARVLEKIKGFVVDNGFVVAVDRLYPSKELNVPNYKLTDFMTLVMLNDSVMKTKDLKKGSTVFIDGKLMTKKRSENGLVTPRIVVGIKEINGR